MATVREAVGTAAATATFPMMLKVASVAAQLYFDAAAVVAAEPNCSSGGKPEELVARIPRIVWGSNRCWRPSSGDTACMRRPEIPPPRVPQGVAGEATEAPVAVG